MSRVWLWVVLVALVALVACSDESAPPGDDQPISFLAELGGDASEFERACAPREFEFPRDHLDHPAFRNEWWYLTGNLQDDKGARFGFQVTLFRIANGADEVTSDSRWSTQQFYMGHFAISAAGRDSIAYHERFARAAAGLAGAAERPVRVWLEDWQLTLHDDESARWSVDVSQGDERVSLDLAPLKPLVLQGDRGHSRKSDDPCNASYYYSFTRLATSGELTVGGQSYQVTGSAWLDREWSSSALSDDQAGWDWFALQMDDGREFMYYRLRSKTGRTDEHSYAVLIERDGGKRIFDAGDITHEVSRWWRSDQGAEYPVEGSLDIAGSDLGKIYYAPLIADQELLLTVRYWEGAIRLSDASGRETGRGYLELTGY
jgi:predicted secreted hydrolase